jgi:hypothetical protein
VPDTEARDDTFEADLTVITPNAWIRRAACLPLLVPVIASVVFGRVGAMTIPHALCLTVALLLLVARRNPWPSLTKERVLANQTTLRVGARTVPRVALRDGFLVPRPGRPPMVRFRRRWPRRPIELQVEHDEEGRRVLRSLRLDASQTVARLKLPSRANERRSVAVAGVGLTFVVAVLLVTIVGNPWPLVGLPAAIVAMNVLWLLPTRLEIGKDGLLVRWAWTQRFVPIGRIRRVAEVTADGFKWVEVVLDDSQGLRAEKLRLNVGQQAWERGEATMIVERIRELLAAPERGRIDVAAAQLRRQGRDVKEWIAALRSIGAGASSFRTAPLAAEQLLRVVEDAGAAPQARAAAAVAVGGELDDEGRSRLEAAVRGVAAPKLRVALESVVARRCDEELEAALAEVDEERVGASRAPTAQNAK